MELAHLGNFGLLGLWLVFSLDPFSWGDDDADETPVAAGDDDLSPVLPITILTDDDDTEVGPDAADKIIALAGDDTVNGGAGDDDIEGNTGDDVIFGDDGDDRISGGAGTDTLFGGAGNDVIGSDRLDANADFPRGGAEQLFGGDGDDRLLFSSGDVVAGDEGQDVFDLVIDPESDDLATISDFDPTRETLTLYVDESPDSGTPQEIEIETDIVNETSIVSLNGDQILRLTGVTDLDSDDIQLAYVSALQF